MAAVFVNGREKRFVFKATAEPYTTTNKKDPI